MATVYLSLGSNLGDRDAYLREAVARLGRLPDTRVRIVSPIVETPAWGNTDQPPFRNLAVALETALAPEALLRATQAVETACGRQRTAHWGPRTLDIDLLDYAGITRETPALRLPHPYLTQRRFVLQPLAAIAPDLRIAGKTVREWLDELMGGKE